MKVKTLSRKAEDFTRERPTDLQPVTRSSKPSLHPFEKAREYARAVNAVKLDKHFSKPFVGNLEGHCDGVWSMAKCAGQLNELMTGGCDGELIQWRLSQREAAWRVRAHRGFCRGITYVPDGQAVLSCGDDKVVKLWTPRESQAARATYLSTHTLTDIDMHWDGELFATAGTELQIWDVSRAKPTNSYTWGSGSFTRVRFNPVERSVLLGLSSDRGITLHDLRAGSSLRKVTMQTRANACAWNPMEAFNFVLASEDHNLYTFDMRKPERALLVHEDHVGPVLDVDFSPTGTEFASGSYDRSIRVWASQGQRSTTVYHTRRMHRIFCVKVSVDAKFVLSGSDDTNVRIWKAKANAKLGALIPREETKAQYSEALVERHKHLPEVRRIVRKQHVPKSILKAKRAKDHMKKAAQRKDDNRRKHSKPGSMPKPSVREARIWKVEQ
ncbi:putative U3 small nucleolar RNA associated protein [Pavlovales sp. CCMP2436]|nr:putative U3 small nucleolar RNA associated protein [Pavlovales sp. CCMP2436]|mmetsp:Transcript_25582/g.64999  ORF Transcript_25582/g.64999 Transcript_25582/m.64999 type:complete len:441 (+) Transcript_25582:71-1393(+)